MKITIKNITSGLNSEKSKRISVDIETKKVLRSYGNYYKKAVKSGEVFLKKSSKQYGGNPLPWEPGGENYFPFEG